MKCIEPIPPIPSQFENDRMIEETVGNQMKKVTIPTGITTISVSTTRSESERRTARLLGAAPSFVITGAAASVANGPPAPGSGAEDRLLLLLDALHERVDVVRVV